MATHLTTGTAADFITYETYKKDLVDHLTRVATASETWVFNSVPDLKLALRFDNNFAKKHLYTFTKKEVVVEKPSAPLVVHAAVAAGAWGKAVVANTTAANDATKQREFESARDAILMGKIANNFNKRLKANVCECGHTYNRHRLNRNQGNRWCPDCKNCNNFSTPYALERVQKGKPTADPLAGRDSQVNTCIVLNRVPKAQFEQIIAKSITKLNPRGAVGVEHKLYWDFQAYPGAVLKARYSGDEYEPDITNLRGVTVVAKRYANAADGREQWMVLHLQG